MNYGDTPVFTLLPRRPRHRPWACVPTCGGGVTARLRRRLIASRNASSPSGRPINSLRRSAAKAGSSASRCRQGSSPRRPARPRRPHGAAQAGKGRADPGHGKRETAELPRVEWARRRSKSSRAPALPERNDRPRGARSPPHICRLTPRRRGPHPHRKPASGACSPNTTHVREGPVVLRNLDEIVIDLKRVRRKATSLDDELFLFLLDMAMLHIKKKSTYLLAQSKSRQIQKVDDYLKRELIN